MEDVELSGSRRKIRSLRYSVAAISLCVGLAVAPTPSIAWAEPTVSASTSQESGPTSPARDDQADRPDTTGPATSDRKGDRDPDVSVSHPKADEASDSAETTSAEFGDGDPEQIHEDLHLPSTDSDAESNDTGSAQPTESTSGESTTPEVVVPEPNSSPAHGDIAPVAEANDSERAHDSTPVVAPASGGRTLLLERPATQQRLAQAATATATESPAPALIARASTTIVEEIAPSAPQPLSPLAKLLKLPGRLVNAVLQIFDFTSSASGPKSPISWAPIDNLIFAAFRELEKLIGLDRPPTPQPAVPTLTYSGSTTVPTPTVAQFLNASAAGYGLGTTPGGLVPFTVNGFQMSSINIFSGHVATAWVTPEQQIIISYQGTTGGTNLLFNPLIAITQVLTDLQIIFTKTTPWAFNDALGFARRVQDAAAEQGYGSDDIFVTGHSLGGWQAQYVAQQIGLGGIGFESPGINTIVPGNGAESMFVNIETYGDPAPLLSTDLPGLGSFMPPYVPGGGSKPHYGSIVMIGDPAAATPLYNVAALWGKGILASFVFGVDFLGNFLQYHLPGIQAYHLGVTPDPGVVPWLGTARGPVLTGYGNLTIPKLMKAASDAGTLIEP